MSRIPVKTGSLKKFVNAGFFRKISFSPPKKYTKIPPDIKFSLFFQFFPKKFIVPVNFMPSSS